MKKLAWYCAVLLLFGSAEAKEQWTPEKAKSWYDGQPWRVGANFIPSTAINQLEMWQAETFDPQTIDRELGWAAAAGMNTMRVYLHDLLWQQDAEGFIKRIEDYLKIGDKHGIKTMFVLFDAVWDPNPVLGKQQAPKPHVHNSGWVQSPSIEVLKDPKQLAELASYVTGIIETFKDDKRVLMWDLYNEPGNANQSTYGDKDAKNKEELSLRLLELAFGWARQINPSQPLTTGVWVGEDWRKDGELSPLNRYILEHSDILTFHSYVGLEKTKTSVEFLKSWSRPILCTEYMARTSGCTFAQHLPYFKEQNIGAIHWGLVAGKTQTQYPWKSWREPFTEEPTLWHHDVFRPDGTPFDAAEVTLFQKLTGKQPAEKIQPAQPKTLQNPVVRINTNKGEIVIELNAEKAPITVANFLAYVKAKFYNGTIFHRVIPNFMIQGGGFTADMQQKGTRPPIKNEAANGLKNLRGTIAMARMDAPDSATCQFFINHKNNTPLDAGPGRPGYAVFGKVIKGMDVVDKIAKVQTTQFGPHGNVPIEPIVILSVEAVNP